MIRTAREIAAQTIVHGVLGFRASLEITDHPRSREICSRLLPWLDELGLAQQIEPFHREILETPYGQLPPESRTEACWCGESASVLGWAVQLLDAPDRQTQIDPARLVARLNLLRPEAANLAATATLRPQQEIDTFCAFCLAVRTRYQQLSVSDDLTPILDRILRKRMAELGLPNADQAVAEAAVFVAETTPPPRGLYVIRALAAEWLLESEDSHG